VTTHEPKATGCAWRPRETEADFLSLDKRNKIAYNSDVKLGKRSGPCREKYVAKLFFPIPISLFPIPCGVSCPAGNAMRQCHCPPQPTPEKVPSGTKSPQRERVHGESSRSLGRGCYSSTLDFRLLDFEKLNERSLNVYENKGALWKD
jgi:hypothetical protein